MDNHLRARKLGGKGTPRLPPKKSTQTQEHILRGIIGSYKTNNIDPVMAVLNADKNFVFEKPKLQCINLGKNNNAYLLTGKSVEQKMGIPDDFEEAASQLNNVETEDATNSSVVDNNYVEGKESSGDEKDETEKEESREEKRDDVKSNQE